MANLPSVIQAIILDYSETWQLVDWVDEEQIKPGSVVRNPRGGDWTGINRDHHPQAVALLLTRLHQIRWSIFSANPAGIDHIRASMVKVDINELSRNPAIFELKRPVGLAKILDRHLGQAFLVSWALGRVPICILTQTLRFRDSAIVRHQPDNRQCHGRYDPGQRANAESVADGGYYIIILSFTGSHFVTDIAVDDMPPDICASDGHTGEVRMASGG